MNVSVIVFSPTGGTMKCAIEFASSLSAVIQRLDLAEPSFDGAVSDDADVVVIAVPSYGGRVPALAVERLRKLDGRSKPTVLMAVYGNRAFEDTLVELQDIALEQGFKPVAAVAAISQHCMDHRIATGRPDVADLASLREFAATVADKISGGGSGDALSIPGNRPYKKAGAGMTPVTDKSCRACGVCASHCPAGAISFDDPTAVDPAKCIGCMRCVAICTAKARRLPAAKRLLVHTFLSATASKRKSPALYL